MMAGSAKTCLSLVVARNYTSVSADSSGQRSSSPWSRSCEKNIENQLGPTSAVSFISSLTDIVPVHFCRSSGVSCVGLLSRSTDDELSKTPSSEQKRSRKLTRFEQLRRRIPNREVRDRP